MSDKDKVRIIGEQEIGENSIEEAMNESVEFFQYSTGISKAVSIPRSSVRVASRNTISSQGCEVPPYNPTELLRYKALDSTYQTCIEIKANTIVGLGHAFRYKDIDKRKDILDFIANPNRNTSDSFTSILKTMYADLEVFHNAYLEFVKSGDTLAIYNLPAKDMYIKSKTNALGEGLREIDKFMYIPSDTTQAIAYEPYPVNGKTKDGIHYVIHFKIASQENLYYGKPDTAHLFDLVKQSYLSDQYNINFFSNGGQPAWAILITGGKLSKKSYQAIKDFIDNSLKGVDNAHKMLFLSVPNVQAKITLVPLSKSIDEQFISLNDKVQFKIALKCHVHPKLLGLSSGGNFGGGSAGIADLKLYIETVCVPEQLYVNEIINRFLKNEFGIDAEFELKIMNISNEKDDAMIANIYWNMKDNKGNEVISINEVRKRFLRMKPIDMKETVIDESKENKNGLEIKPNAAGDVRTKNNKSLDIGDGEQINNLDPEKNKK